MDHRNGFDVSHFGAVLALALAASFGAPAFAQAPPADRPAAPAATAPEAPTVEDGAILPSAEGHVDSEAPSMGLDCDRDPASCENPLTQPAEGPALSTPSGDPTDPDAGAPVVATPGK